MANTIQIKRGLSTSWSTKNPVLAEGEIGFATDTKKVKVGDGSTAWNSLDFIKIDKTDINNLVDGNGKLLSSLLPDLAIGTVQVVTYTDSETVGQGDPVVAAFKGITAAESGDFAVVTTTKGASETDAAYLARQTANGDGVYIYAGNTDGATAYSTADWKLIKVPGSAIQSVNSKVGSSVTLGSDDISEGSSNLYYTDARVATKVGSMAIDGGSIDD